MDAVIARIKEYVLIVDSTITDDAKLDFYIADTKDRALVIMNRIQLVDGYEEFLLGNFYYPLNCTYNIAGDEVPVLPIPTEVERAIARVIVSVYNTAEVELAKQREVIKVKDNNQEVTFSGVLGSYFSSLSDKELFSDIKTVLNKFRLATVVH